MYGGQYPSAGVNNESSIKLLWAGLISYVIGLITPQFTTDPVYFIDSSLFAWDLLTPLGLGFIALGIVLTYIGITKARLFEGVKKYTVSGALLVLIPVLVIQSIKTDYRNNVGRDIVDYSIGYYALWLGVILTAIGSFKAISYPAHISHGYSQQQTGYHPQYSPGYQQGQQPSQPQQQYQQPNYNQVQNQPPQQFQPAPVQPPSYIEPEPRYSESQPIQSDKTIYEKQSKHNYCGTCGQDNEIGVRFCVNCGTKFENAIQ